MTGLECSILVVLQSLLVANLIKSASGG